MQCKLCEKKAIYTTLQLCGGHRNQLYVRENRERRTEYFRKYRKTDRGRLATQKAVRKYEQKNREKRSAWTAVQNIKKEACSVCGKKPVHAHHPNYEKPKEVIFLCPLHHKQMHSAV